MKRFILFVIVVALGGSQAFAQKVGDWVALVGDIGVPVHPASHDQYHYSRWESGTIARITAFDGWFEVQRGDGQKGWVISDYLRIVRPPRLSKPQASASEFKFELGSTYQRPVIVEWSHDLVTWTPFQTNTGPLLASLQITNTATGEKRFYRAQGR